MHELRGEAACITSGANGIGLGIAGAFVDAGMNVVLADLRQDLIDAALAIFGKHGHTQSVHAIRVDVTDRPAMTGRAGLRWTGSG